jgi:hypothetical protein
MADMTWEAIGLHGLHGLHEMGWYGLTTAVVTVITGCEASLPGLLSAVQWSVVKSSIIAINPMP